MNLHTLPIGDRKNPNWTNITLKSMAMRQPFVPGKPTHHLINHESDIQYLTWSSKHEQNFCLLCWKWVDMCHLSSPRHTKKVKTYPSLWDRYFEDSLVIHTYMCNDLYPNSIRSIDGKRETPIWLVEEELASSVPHKIKKTYAMHRHTNFITTMKLPQNIPVEICL